MTSRKNPIMELSDEQLVLMTWDVAVRKGWGFVVDTLLRGGVDVFSPASGVCKDQGFRGQFGDWSQQGLIPEDNPMVSQESGDEEDEITVMDKSCLNSNEWPSWTGQCPRCSATTLSSREESPVLSTKGKYQGGTSVHSKIKEFIVEVTSVFHNYFSGLEMPGSKPTLPSCEPSDPALIYGQPGLSAGMLVQRPSKDAQAQAPSWDASSVPVGPLPTVAISRARPLPQQVLPSVAVTGSVLPAPAGVADDFHWVKPLAAHVPRKLRETVRKQQLDDEAAMKKKPRQHQEPELGMGDLVKFGTICSKCGGKHPSAECTIVKPGAESLIQENQKNPNGGPETKDYCTFYNKGECSVGEICRYKHVCSGCGDNHPWVKCSKLNPMSQPLKRSATRRGKRRANKKKPICQKYNIEKCTFGNICVFKHVCSECYRPHPVVKCGRVNYLN